MEIPVYPAAMRIGGESSIAISNAKPVHLHWSAYASDDDVDVVLAFYRQQLGAATEAPNSADATWRFPADAPTRTLHVLPIHAPGVHQQFQAQWPTTAQTAIIIAHMAR
jgi:hypothetical protein